MLFRSATPCGQTAVHIQTMTSALFLSTDTLDKPLEGYAAHRKTPPSTDSLTQRSYLTHNKTAATPNGPAAATVARPKAPHASQSRSIRREARSAKRAAGTDPIKVREARYLFPSSNPPKTGHRRARHQFTFRHTPQEALAALHIRREARHSPLSFNHRRPRTKGADGFPSECIPQHEAPLSAAPKEQDKGASSARTHSEGNPSGPGESHRAIDYPVFCNPAETPVTVERIRLMYSAFFSSAISSWFIRTSRRART